MFTVKTPARREEIYSHILRHFHTEDFQLSTAGCDCWLVTAPPQFPQVKYWYVGMIPKYFTISRSYQPSRKSRHLSTEAVLNTSLLCQAAVCSLPNHGRPIDALGENLAGRWGEAKEARSGQELSFTQHKSISVFPQSNWPIFTTVYWN